MLMHEKVLTLNFFNVKDPHLNFIQVLKRKYIYDCAI
jgi:hypothetical protein